MRGRVSGYWRSVWWVIFLDRESGNQAFHTFTHFPGNKSAVKKTLFFGLLCVVGLCCGPRLPVCAGQPSRAMLLGAADLSAVSDLARDLDAPTEGSICDVLKARLLEGHIYTGMSAMLLAVNPCQLLPQLYSEATLARYLGSEPDLPPHIYRTAARVYRGVLMGRCQSVVISGESGAGK